MQADGMQMPEIKSRVAMARQRHGKMRHVWSSNKLHPWLKMRLYVAGVCSVMVYGAETWLLTKEATRLINGANSQMVAVITNNTPKEEATESTRTFDLIANIRAKRLKWLGLILRMDEGRMLKSAVKLMYDNRKEGDLLMDAPAASSWEGLCNMAKNEKEWGKKVKQIKEKVHRMKRKKRRRGGDSEDEDDEDEDRGGGGEKREKKKQARKKINRAICCRDGFRMSVQASRDHFCVPRADVGPYTHVEVASTNELEELLLPFADGPQIVGTRPELYVRVPAEVVRAVIRKHAGILQGQLPQLIAEEEDDVEYDEDGYAWAAAAPVPEDDSEEKERER